jgi:small RNA 2'-O-methyltransferase
MSGAAGSRDHPFALPPAGEDPSTALHEERLDAVVEVLRASGASSVLDLGCGSGALLRRLALEEQFTRIVGVDTSAAALFRAERMLASLGGADVTRIALHHGSFTSAEQEWMGFDAAAMVETIEHIPPEHLSQVERAVFAQLRPSLLLMTTPNRDYNVLYGKTEKENRHPDHRFEWSRSRFRGWATGVAERNGYHAAFADVGRADPLLGSSTQMAIFRLRQCRGDESSGAVMIREEANPRSKG